MERDDGQIERPRRRRSRFVRGLGGGLLAIALVALGVAAGVWEERRSSGGSSPNPGRRDAAPSQGGMAMPGMSSPQSAPASAVDPPAEVEVVLTPDALARTGIKTATVGAVESRASVRVPGSVMPNAYREVKVTPIVGGIATKVNVALGEGVRRGAPIVTLFSAELADAQT